MIIEQFLPAFHYGDATSNSAVTLHEFFISKGIESRLITLTSDKRVLDKVILYKDYKEDQDSVKILHFAIPSPLTDFFLKAKGKKILIYHNITPSKFFVDYSEFLVKFTKDGREHLKRLSNVFDLSVGVSEFNARELREINFKNVVVSPLPVNLKNYDTPYNKGYYNLIKDDRKNILCVGRVAPNKALEDAVKALFFYKKYISPSVRLIIAGNTESVPKYFFAVRDLASRFYLTSEDILFTGHIEFDEFISVYKLADLFLSVSEHEGFCLPILESFYLGTPVVAYDAAAISETLGEGGILFKNKSPDKLAALMDYVINSEKVSEKLIKSGYEMIDKYKSKSYPETLLKMINKL